jgi:hypothetical protein
VGNSHEAHGGAIMADQDALIAFQLGESLDQETIRRLWTSGYIEVANHDTCQMGQENSRESG